jgi:regulator of sigma E protease
MDVVYFIVLVGVLIFVHESGHFLWAKLFGVRVLTFSLGFGPRVAGFSRGGTEYVIAAIPLGGYVRMLGENPHDEVQGADESSAFHTQALWKRVVIVFAGPMMNLMFPVALYFVVFLGTTTLSPAIVGDVFPGQPAEGKLKPGDRVVAIDGQSIDTFYELTRRIAPEAGRTLSFSIERDGQRVSLPITPTRKHVERPLDLSEDVGRIGISLNQPLAIVGISDPKSPAANAGLKTYDWVISGSGTPTRRWTDLARVLDSNHGSLVPLTVLRPERLRSELGQALGVSVYKPHVATLTPNPGEESGSVRAGLERTDLYVSQVLKASSEARAGLLPGDRIVALDERPIRHFTALLEQLEAERGAPHTLSVRRAGGLVDLHYTLAKKRSGGDYEKPGDRYVIGLRRFEPTVPYTNISNPAPISYAFGEAFRATSEVVELTTVSIVRLLQGRLSMKTLGGPLTIYDAASDAAREGALNYLFLMGFISVNLGLINLMPIPLLDGGHLLFLLLELISRKPISVRVREYASILGLTVLILLMVFAFKNDVERQWPELFQSRSAE